jgi:hypothetical protein
VRCGAARVGHAYPAPLLASPRRRRRYFNDILNFLRDGQFNFPFVSGRALALSLTVRPRASQVSPLKSGR